MERRDPEQILDRIARLDLASPAVDAVAITRAFTDHLRLLELEPLPVRFSVDVASAQPGCTYGRDSREWLRARARCRPARMGAPDMFSISPPGTHAAVAIPSSILEEIAAAVDHRRRGPRHPASPNQPISPNPAWRWVAEIAHSSGVTDHIEADPDVARWENACCALAEAYIAGLAFFWVLADEVVCVPHPVIRGAEGRLHATDGPAVAWPGGEAFWYLPGVRVRRHVVVAPHTITAREVQRERNLERRRILLERMGYDRYVQQAGGRLVSEDPHGRLWRCPPLPDAGMDPAQSENLTFVEVVNATAEPDGSRRRYFLRVPPAMRTAHQAVAWTFGLDPKSYRPDLES